MSDIIPAYDTSPFFWCWLTLLLYLIYQCSCGLDGFSLSHTVFLPGWALGIPTDTAQVVKHREADCPHPWRLREPPDTT